LPAVLLIEVSATIRQLAANLLIKAGYQVTLVKDLDAALERFNSASADLGLYDAAVLGWPDQGGGGADEVLNLFGRHNLPVLTMAHERDSTLEDRLGGNLNSSMLLWQDYKKTPDVLARLILDANSRDSTGHDSIPMLQPIRVLFVDDSRTVRLKYERLLKANGYIAETACSVDEGMQKALQSPFDIAIIDYFMPDATGDVLCRKIRDHERTTGITTAIITGTYLDQEIKQSLEAGAVECMFKNESDDLFLTRIDAMSRHVRAHKSIENERVRLGGILRSVGEGVYGVDSNGNILFVNPACRRILGYAAQDRLIGRPALEIFHYNDELGNPLDRANCFLFQSYTNGTPLRARETVFWDKSGDPVSVECTAQPLTIENETDGSVVAFRDISERKLLESELRWQASHDVLTKLYNRRYFEEQLQVEAERVKRSEETSALLYLDLDRFKYINDTAGHAAGDRLLIEISQQMTKRLRKADMLARLGGDEFAIILRNVERDSVHNVADEFRKMLDQYMFVYNGKQYKVNGTIGIALIDKSTESPGEILADADIACHIAKSEGRNRTHLFIPQSDSKAAMDKDLGWSSRLHNALQQDLFLLHAQPIVPIEHIRQDLINASEAPIFEQLVQTIPQQALISEVLLRMDDPQWGLVFPGAFLPTAERFNMMDKIDFWVVNAALRKLSQLQQHGYQGMFTINLSGQSIGNTSMLQGIEALIGDIDVDTSKIILEITETSAVSDLGAANELIERLKTKGCRFALDDFGSGFSSFSHLKNLPVEYIKIDGLFVRGVVDDVSDRAIVQSMNDIAHSLGKKTIAEYVENAEILSFLMEAGVDYVQGHYISTPMDISLIQDETGSLVRNSAQK
jgi:diguanylate cyclase (GGDEF)-like protein/PAS domain S-box-containing protein